MLGLACLGILYTAIVVAGYEMLGEERDAPPMWLVVISFTTGILPFCIFLLKGKQVVRKRKED